MNDTIELWRVYYGCKRPAIDSRSSQAFVISFLAAVVCVVTSIFYAGSYIQGERLKRKLIKCAPFYLESFYPGGSFSLQIHDFIILKWSPKRKGIVVGIVQDLVTDL